ncbi:hypothetical protein BJ165DRAFT_1132131 [Panaeolus papilionaceus]|nr:hypothetical protein BJ165DRAFT_1132131 [Panaeolus papilionaceus]
MMSTPASPAPSSEIVHAFDSDIVMGSDMPVAREQPTEVIHEILRIAVPPPHLLPFTHRPLLHPSDHPRTKILPLLTVCRSWYRAGLPLLYRDILITRRSQVVRLLSTLQRYEDPTRRYWPESIEVRDVLPQEIASVEFREAIEKLLEMCPNLTTYAYQESFRYSTWMVYAHVYPRLSSPITHLHLQWVSLPNELAAALLETARSLQSLCISFAHNCLPGRWPLMTLFFPHLHTLSLPQDSQSLRICSNWEIPSLTRLLFWMDWTSSVEYRGGVYIPWNTHWGIDQKTGDAFFSKFAAKLKVLEIYRNDFIQNSNTDSSLIVQFLQYAPVLEHLILHHQGNHDRSSEFSFGHFWHRNVKWVDVWAEDSVQKVVKDLRRLGAALISPNPHADNGKFIGNITTNLPTNRVPQFFPAARGFRIFPTRLASWSHLPLLIVPSSHPFPHVVQFPLATEVVSNVAWTQSKGHTLYDSADDSTPLADTGIIDYFDDDSSSEDSVPDSENDATGSDSEWEEAFEEDGTTDSENDTTGSEWEDALEVDGGWGFVLEDLKNEQESLERVVDVVEKAIREDSTSQLA